MAEYLIVVQERWVQFPLIALCRKRQNFYFSKDYICLNSSVVEHWTENPRAVGSIPALSKRLYKNYIINVSDLRFCLLGEMVDALDLKFSSFRVSVQVR